MTCYSDVTGLVVLAAMLAACSCVKIKIIGKPFSFRGKEQSQPNVPQTVVLTTDVQPQAITGPQHLHTLAGQCFSLQKATYKFEFCPFHNVTQIEQSYRWNAYSGVLGVWKEWIISNGTFQGMLMAHGDSCVGTYQRMVKVFFQCGNHSHLASVKEPSTCKYEMAFLTPLACPIDAMAVFPVLDGPSQIHYKTLHAVLQLAIVTANGYKRMMTGLLRQNNLLATEAKPPAIVVDQNASNANNSTPDDLFSSKAQCTEEFKRLRLEIKELRSTLSKCSANSTRATTLTTGAIPYNIPTGDQTQITPQKNENEKERNDSS